VTRYVTPGARCDLVYAVRAAGSLYRSFLAIIAQAILASLLASAMAATLVGRRVNNPVSQRWTAKQRARPRTCRNDGRQVLPEEISKAIEPRC
jgi:multidrug efflux pump subunit AcrB